MSKIKVGFDIDGILARFNEAYINLIYTHTGIRLPDESDAYPNTWHFERAAGIEKSRENAMWKEIKDSPTFWQMLRPYEDSISPMRRFATWVDEEANHDLETYYITNRQGNRVLAQTDDWLLDTYQELVYANTICARNKGKMAAALELDLYIDDKLENCEDVVRLSPQTRCFILDRPWNRGREVTGCKRLYDLGAYIDEIIELYEAKKKESNDTTSN